MQPITFETMAIDILHVLKDVIGEATFGGEKVRNGRTADGQTDGRMDQRTGKWTDHNTLIYA